MKNSPLAKRIEMYRESVRGTSDRRGRQGNWTAFAAATGSALAMASNVSASIIHIQPASPVTVSVLPVGPNNTTHDFAALNIGGGAFGLTVKQNSSTSQLVAFHASNGAEVAVTGGGNELKRLNSGAAISSLPNWIQGDGNLVQARGTTSAGTVFAGIRFGETGGGKYEYGWVRLEFIDEGDFGAVQEKAIDWAYNSIPGGSITAGEESMPSAPEPSTGALAMLAAGWAGVLAWRKHRPSRRPN